MYFLPRITQAPSCRISEWILEYQVGTISTRTMNRCGVCQDFFNYLSIFTTASFVVMCDRDEILVDITHARSNNTSVSVTDAVLLTRNAYCLADFSLSLV